MDFFFFFFNLKLFKGRTGNKDKLGAPRKGLEEHLKESVHLRDGGGTVGVGVSWEESRLTGDPVIGTASVEGWGLGAGDRLAPGPSRWKDARGGQQGNEPGVQSLL